MTEYINRQAVLDLFWKDGRIATPGVKEIPTADVAPVVHSRFVNMGGFPACERCGASPGFVEPKPKNPSGFPPYCYAYGAKMDKEDE